MATSLRALIPDAERYRQTVSEALGLGTTESQSHRWLAATLELIDRGDLELVSASFAIITKDLSSRTSGNDQDDDPPLTPSD